MKHIFETPIGNLARQTFRPTEAQKAVLSNIDRMLSSGRTVTEQDAINVPKEALEHKGIARDNLEAAFLSLVKVELIQIEPDKTVTLTKAGQAVVDEIKKAEQQTVTSGSASGIEQIKNPFESFTLIGFLNDQAKITKN